jgi:hypothetical protein
MGDHSITWTELLMVVLVGSAPALIAACTLQVRYSSRRGWASGARWLRPVVMCILTVAIAIPTTVVLWATLPEWLLRWQAYLRPAPGPLLFMTVLLFPSMLGAAIGTVVARGVARGLRWRDGA